MKNFSYKSILIALMVLLILAVPFLYSSLTRYDSEFQAVFLTNGQVYFGKITRQSPKMITLTNVYYFQSQGQSEQPLETTDTKNLKLVKLGTELHGPTDEMRIVLNNVLFTEELSADSKVVQSIKSSI